VNSLVELHDSVLAALVLRDGDAVLSLRPAYIHRSSGRPGSDPGTGWTQDLEITITDATVSGSSGLLPAHISEGSLKIGNEDYPSALPMVPLGSPVHLALVMETGSRVEIGGRRLTVVSVGEAQYVEEFPGANLG
jgi:hypothetical protein